QRMTDRQPWLSIESSNTHLQVVRSQHVVVSCPLKILTVGPFEDVVKIRSRPQVPLLAMQLDAGILLGILLANSGGIISRSIIGDDQPEISKALVENRTNCLFQVILAIADGQANRHARA